MSVVTSKKIKRNNNFITISRKEYNDLIALKKIIPTLKQEMISENDILRWSREARTLRKKRKLPLLRSLRGLR